MKRDELRTLAKKLGIRTHVLSKSGERKYTWRSMKDLADDCCKHASKYTQEEIHQYFPKTRPTAAKTMSMEDESGAPAPRF